MATEKKPDYIFWTLIGILILWMVLKLAGVINTPTIIELIPFGAIAAIMIYMHQLHDKRHDKIDNRLLEHGNKISHIEQRLSSLESKTEIILDLLKSKTK